MTQRRFGVTELSIIILGCGTWGMGGGPWRDADDNLSVASLRRAIELGVNFIDTALSYGSGHAERLIGAVIREVKGKVVVGTKIPPKNNLRPPLHGVRVGEVFPYDHIVSCTERSLRNLNLECLELQQFHVWNSEWLADDTWNRAVEDLKKSGKIRYFGVSLSNHQPDSGIEIVRSGLIDSVQVIYNIFDQSAAAKLFPACLEENVAVVVRSPLDEGALTGAIHPETVFADDDFRAIYFRERRKLDVETRIHSLEGRLKSKGLSSPLSEVALRFCFSHPAVTTTIAGMRRVCKRGFQLQGGEKLARMETKS